MRHAESVRSASRRSLVGLSTGQRESEGIHKQTIEHFDKAKDRVKPTNFYQCFSARDPLQSVHPTQLSRQRLRVIPLANSKRKNNVSFASFSKRQKDS